MTAPNAPSVRETVRAGLPHDPISWALLSLIVVNVVVRLVDGSLPTLSGWFVALLCVVMANLWHAIADNSRLELLQRDAPPPALWPSVRVETITRKCGYCGLTLAAPVMQDLSGPLRDSVGDRVMSLHWQRCTAAPLETKTS